MKKLLLAGFTAALRTAAGSAIAGPAEEVAGAAARSQAARNRNHNSHQGGNFMRQFNLATAGIAFVALLLSAPAMAQAYNENNIGWNRGGILKTDTAGTVPQCFKNYGTGKFDGPRLVGASDAATHPFQNFWGRCESFPANAHAAALPNRQKHAHR